MWERLGTGWQRAAASAAELTLRHAQRYAPTPSRCWLACYWAGCGIDLQARLAAAAWRARQNSRRRRPMVCCRPGEMGSQQEWVGERAAQLSSEQAHKADSWVGRANAVTPAKHTSLPTLLR